MEVGGEERSWGGTFFLPGFFGFEAPIQSPVFFWFFLETGAKAPSHPASNRVQASASPLDPPGQWHRLQVKKHGIKFSD